MMVRPPTVLVARGAIVWLEWKRGTVQHAAWPLWAGQVRAHTLCGVMLVKPEPATDKRRCRRCAAMLEPEVPHGE